MTLEELEQCCTEAEETAKEWHLNNPSFNVFVEGAKYGRYVKIASGLTGMNLGHYPKGTMVMLYTARVRKWLKAQQ